MPSPSLAVVIVEDDRHRMLVYRYLRSRGLSSHAIRIKHSPSGRGSAEQWIRAMFATEVKAYRIRQARAATVLIAMIDADAHTVQQRLNQLAQSLDENGIPRVSDTEQIAQVVPKRNVETWILFLTGQAVSEETDYKQVNRGWEELIPQAAETLSNWTRTNAAPPSNCIDSLRRGVTELIRLRL